MPKETIKCPKCGQDIELTEALSHDIEEKAKARLQEELQKLRQSAAVEIAKKEAEFQKTLKEVQHVAQEKAKKAAEEVSKFEMADLKSQLADLSKQRDEAQKREIEMRQRQRELEAKEKALQLELERKLDDERKKLIEEMTKDFDERHQLKDAEKDKQLADMRRQIDDLKRKAEQGSQQTQGEVLELQIEELLKQEFPFDDIEPVPKGIRGADVRQTVKSQSGRSCGMILWETKRTKNWSDSWLQKLKDDQRDLKASISVLVSETLPKGFHHFRQLDGVWVTDIPSALSLAIALRMILMQVYRAQQLQAGKSEKMEEVYNYLTGPEFRNRVEAVVEAFKAMKEDLDTEKRLMTKNWAKREKQIERVIAGMLGMHGDLEGIAGTLPAVKLLQLSEFQSNDEKKTNG